MISERYFSDEKNRHYQLNGKDIAEPAAFSTDALKALGLFASARFAHVSAPSTSEVVFNFTVRYNSISGTGLQHRVSETVDVLIRVKFDGRCDQLEHSVHWFVDAAALDVPVLAAAFAPLNPLPGCRKGELLVNSTCTALTCESPRACPRNFCQKTAPDASGVAFKCGCPVGTELNGHTMRCVIVTCEAPGACQPTAKCVAKTRDELLGSVNCIPTTTAHQQWLRGSAPCVRFNCISESNYPTKSQKN
jgi:hypothetical protein